MGESLDSPRSKISLHPTSICCQTSPRCTVIYYVITLSLSQPLFVDDDSTTRPWHTSPLPLHSHPLPVFSFPVSGPVTKSLPTPVLLAPHVLDLPSLLRLTTTMQPPFNGSAYLSILMSSTPSLRSTDTRCMPSRNGPHFTSPPPLHHFPLTFYP